MTTLSELVPEITDEDIEWISGLMKLEGLDEQRLAFLRSRETLDVSACPGSGKTTLVVAKLAMLARKWKSRTRGICVLSHTNVARHEIEQRLGDTEVGRRLLNYPTTSTQFMASSDVSSPHPGSSPLNTVSPRSTMS